MRPEASLWNVGVCFSNAVFGRFCFGFDLDRFLPGDFFRIAGKGSLTTVASCTACDAESVAVAADRSGAASDGPLSKLGTSCPVANPRVSPCVSSSQALICLSLTASCSNSFASLSV
jgi:hypothetical protein